MKSKSPVRKRGCKCEGKCKCGATWSYRLELGPDPKTGRRRQTEKHGFTNQKEAELAYAKALLEVSQGTYIAEKNTTFADYADQWIEIYSKTGKVRNSTICIRRSRLKIIKLFFLKIKIKDITRKMYQDMLIELKTKVRGDKIGYAKKTIESVHETAKLLFAKAVDQEIITSDPTHKAELPTFNKTVEELEEETEIPKYLEKEELAKFLKVAESGEKDDYIIFHVLAYTGLRVGELVALKWRDIDMNNQTISITKTVYTKDGIANFILNPPKTKKSKRIIDIDSDTIKLLKSHKARQNAFKLEQEEGKYNDRSFVFSREDHLMGDPFSAEKIRIRMIDLLFTAGLNNTLTPHSLRHTHTSLLAEAGTSLEAIMERLGHKSDRVTREIYLHVTKTRKKEAVQKFSELMNSVR
jgi:integrase